jgi:hypothetical protein
MNSPISLTSTHHADLRRKVVTVIWSLRIVACVYTAWVFWLIIRPLRDSSEFLSQLGHYWQRDLNTVAHWQIWSVVSINLILWLLLCVAVICIWQASRQLIRDMSIGPVTSTWFQRGAWAGLCSALLGMAIRPFMSYLYTLHLPTELQLWRWEVHPNDLMDLLICGVLLMLSYLMAWMAEIAEENKAFV